MPGVGYRLGSIILATLFSPDNRQLLVPLRLNWCESFASNASLEPAYRVRPVSMERDAKIGIANGSPRNGLAADLDAVFDLGNDTFSGDPVAGNDQQSPAILTEAARVSFRMFWYIPQKVLLVVRDDGAVLPPPFVDGLRIFLAGRYVRLLEQGKSILYVKIDDESVPVVLFFTEDKSLSANYHLALRTAKSPPMLWQGSQRSADRGLVRA